jgi:hypothetical protein
VFLRLHDAPNSTFNLFYSVDLQSKIHSNNVPVQNQVINHEVTLDYPLLTGGIHSKAIQIVLSRAR